MFGFKRHNKEEHRYYLLPGMGRCNKQKRKRTLNWAIVVGVVVSIIFGYVVYSMNQL